MTLWEYETCDIQDDDDDVDLLNRLGKQGWELVSVTRWVEDKGGDIWTRLYFKRLLTVKS